ncbi:MAG: DNA-protecting protein DprA [Gemmatimonadales bacterium]|nr:DNA-protecting protein DprA [Gemmatimonadales bacterium]
MNELEGAEREAYLTLALVPGIGAVRLQRLLARFGHPSSVLAAPAAAVAQTPTISLAAAHAIGAADRRVTERALLDLERLGGRLLLPGDAEFPGALTSIPDPPTCLFVQGSLGLLTRPIVAIVGSRDHSEYGALVCKAVARAVAALGIVVVSGMARGLDAIAHSAALDAPGTTIGVLGNGLGVIYPAANRRLYERVARDGLLVTEFPPGDRPTAGSFPRRNRLISGLARTVVVVEAAIASGALQTVACALDQGRDVLAVPGPVTSPVSAGVNRLIRDGATPLLELADLLQFYSEVARPAKAAAGVREPLGESIEGRLLNALWAGPRGAEALVEMVDAGVEKALEALSALELSGKVSQDAGGLYRSTAGGLFT